MAEIQIISMNKPSSRAGLSALNGFRVYAIDFGPAGVKIGFTGNISSRIYSLELEMRRFGVEYKTTAIAVTLPHHWVNIGEKQMHDHFHSHRTNGEFFDVPFNSVVSAMSEINTTDDPDPDRGERAQKAINFLSGLVTGRSIQPVPVPQKASIEEAEQDQVDLGNYLAEIVNAKPKLFASSLAASVAMSPDGSAILRRALKILRETEAVVGDC